MRDCTYVNKIIAKYDKNGQLTQNERTAYSNLSQALNNWFNATYNRYTYYPKLSIQQLGSRAKGTAIKGKSDIITEKMLLVNLYQKEDSSCLVVLL